MGQFVSNVREWWNGPAVPSLDYAPPPGSAPEARSAGEIYREMEKMAGPQTDWGAWRQSAERALTNKLMAGRDADTVRAARSGLSGTPFALAQSRRTFEQAASPGTAAIATQVAQGQQSDAARRQQLAQVAAGQAASEREARRAWEQSVYDRQYAAAQAALQSQAASQRAILPGLIAPAIQTGISAYTGGAVGASTAGMEGRSAARTMNAYDAGTGGGYSYEGPAGSSYGPERPA